MFCRSRQRLVERRQDARARFDQGYFELGFVEHFEPVVAQRLGGVVQLGSELDAGCAAAHDADAHARLRIAGLMRVIGAQAGI